MWTINSSSRLQKADASKCKNLLWRHRLLPSKTWGEFLCSMRYIWQWLLQTAELYGRGFKGTKDVLYLFRSLSNAPPVVLSVPASLAVVQGMSTGEEGEYSGHQHWDAFFKKQKLLKLQMQESVLQLIKRAILSDGWWRRWQLKHQ